jgi:uncharacterized protein (TIGR00730 family)
MNKNRTLDQRILRDAKDELQGHADLGTPVQPDAYRFAFADPEFLLRRETRGVRMQLELMKPDLEQQALGVQHTVVVFGSARMVSKEVADQRLAQAQQTGDIQSIKLAQRDMRNSVYYEHAREFAKLVAAHCEQVPAEDRIYICTGGGPGIMEAANRGAHEAGAPSVGLNIALPHEQYPNPYITPQLCFKFHYFALRKMHFMMRAKALVAFPGGFGTLDELFEILTLVQTHKSQRVPIILFGSAFWKRIVDFEFLIEEGTISAEDLDLFKLVDTPEDALHAIRVFYGMQDESFCDVPAPQTQSDD